MFQFSKIMRHVSRHKFCYIGIFILFFLGFLIGGFYSNAIGEEAFSESVQVAENFIQGAKNHTLELKLLLSEELQPLVLIFILGFFLFGFPLILFFIFKTGFSYGFFLAFLIKAFSLKGLFLGSFFLMLYLLFLLPSLCALSYRALGMNHFFVSCAMHDYGERRSLKTEIFLLTVVFACCSLAVAVGVLLKFWLLPFLCGYLFA